MLCMMLYYQLLATVYRVGHSEYLPTLQAVEGPGGTMCHADPAVGADA